jgi:hypothetical protein
MHKSAHRTPLNIDNVAIDFSSITASSTAATAAGASPSPTTAAVATAVPGLLELLQQQAQQHDDGRQRVSDVRAFDPALQGVAQRQLNVAGAAVARRKKVFGGQPHVPPPSTETAKNTAEPHATSQRVEAGVVTPAKAQNTGDGVKDASAAQDALDFLIHAQQKQQQSSSPSDLLRRRDAYTQQLRVFCHRGRTQVVSKNNNNNSSSSKNNGADTLTFPSTSSSHTNSLLTQLFADGVPDIEPWDRWTSAMPRYGELRHLVVHPHSATPKQIHEAGLDLVHHPVIPDTHYTRHYQYRDLEQPVLQKEYKTKDELRAERRERLREKQAKRKQERAAADSASISVADMGAENGSSALTSLAASGILHDRLSIKNLALNLFASSVLNPLAADTIVLQQYELRDLAHQRRNHERHVAALPNQIQKRERDQVRFATEHPILRAYRVFPIYSPAHLGKLRHYANDNLLRGFVLYVADCDALVVLSGGEKAMRHLDHWILEKMAWEHHDTRATRLLTVPLMDAASFSFHMLPSSQSSSRAGGGGRVYKQGKLVEGATAAHTDDRAAGEESSKQEPVFMNMVASVAEGEAFLRQLPAPSSPWSDLSAIWRTAFLKDGLQED